LYFGSRPVPSLGPACQNDRGRAQTAQRLTEASRQRRQMPWRPVAGRAASFFALQLLLGAAYLGADYLPMQGVRRGVTGIDFLASSSPATRASSQPGDQVEAQQPRREPAPPAPMARGADGPPEAEPPRLGVHTAGASSQGLPVSPEPEPPWMTKADVLSPTDEKQDEIVVSAGKP
ncbi:unnamed protein product, partial [Prorocentrum cordatum]